MFCTILPVFLRFWRIYSVHYSSKKTRRKCVRWSPNGSTLMKPCFVICEDHINLAKTLSTGLLIFKCTLKLWHKNYLAQYIYDAVPCLHFYLFYILHRLVLCLQSNDLKLNISNYCKTLHSKNHISIAEYLLKL